MKLQIPALCGNDAVRWQVSMHLVQNECQLQGHHRTQKNQKDAAKILSINFVSYSKFIIKLRSTKTKQPLLPEKTFSRNDRATHPNNVPCQI